MASRSAQLPVYVVEDHDEALPLIYRAIGSRQLPFERLALIHFDAHPDLLCPNILADDLTDKDLLFSSTTIADWIIPAIYMGHISGMVWLRPPWAQQITEGTHDLVVGRDRSSGYVRVGTPLPYFIGELLYVDRDELENSLTIPLHVVTVPPALQLQSAESMTDDATVPPATKKLKRASATLEALPGVVAVGRNAALSDHRVDHGTGEEALGGASCVDIITQLLSEVISVSQAWILDIDLDFFSTGNPYRSLFTDDEYDLMTRLYKLEELHSSQNLDDHVQKRKAQLTQLEKWWRSGEADSGELDCQDDDVLSSFNLQVHEIELMKKMRGLIGAFHDGAFVDGEYLHLAGIVTDLPVHQSSEEEIAGLVNMAETLLTKLSLRQRPPGIVTIARSTEDEYTPANQVELIQDSVTTVMKRVYHRHDLACVTLKYHYLTRTRKDWVYEPPAEICDCTYL